MSTTTGRRMKRGEVEQTTKSTTTMREEATSGDDKEPAERMEELPGERAAGGKEERWQLGYEL